MASDSPWTWSESEQDYYYLVQDSQGNRSRRWSKDQDLHASQPRSSYPASNTDARPRTDSLDLNAQEARGVDSLNPDTIRGTPGESERLDPSYRVRINREAHDFFKVGKVFAMLHVQAASESDLINISDNISIVKYGERAFSQIRRFVIVQVKRGHVDACPISTYSGRGTLKNGCNASEHSVVYLSGTSPYWFDGERERGLPEQAIPIKRSIENTAPRMDKASRLHYGKTYPIEKNVKVKDIGDVEGNYLSYLLQRYQEVNFSSTYTQPVYQPEYTHASSAQQHFHAYNPSVQQQPQSQMPMPYQGSMYQQPGQPYQTNYYPNYQHPNPGDQYYSRY